IVYFSGSCVLVFLLSSRRRHTRCYRDWSSDVCSSDLALAAAEAAGGGERRREALLQVGAGQHAERGRRRIAREILADDLAVVVRSEERRVGKGSRSRRSTVQQRKKVQGDEAGDYERRP